MIASRSHRSDRQRLRWGYNSLSAALLKDLAEEEPINTRPGGGFKDIVELFTTKNENDATRFCPLVFKHIS